MPSPKTNGNAVGDLLRQIDHWTAGSKSQVIFINEQLEAHARSLPNWPVVSANLRELYRQYKRIESSNRLLALELNQHLNCIPGDHFEKPRSSGLQAHQEPQ